MSMVEDECTHCGLLHGHMATCPAYQKGGDATSHLSPASTPAPQSPDQACGAESDAAFVERIAPSVLIHVQHDKTEEGNSDHDRLIAIARLGASRPAPADAVKVLVEALEPLVKAVGAKPTDESVLWSRAAAALSDPRVIAAQAADPWLPIASAPRNRLILLYERHAEGGFTFVGRANADGDWCNNLDFAIQNPNFWMPLPAAPARQQEEPS